VTDDRRVDEQIQRFGGERAQRGHCEAKNLAIVRVAGRQVGETSDVMRTYRFYGFTPAGAAEMRTALVEDGMEAAVLEPGARPLPGWVVEADGEDDRSEGLLEMLAQFFGGAYEGENLSGA